MGIKKKRFWELCSVCWDYVWEEFFKNKLEMDIMRKMEQKNANYLQTSIYRITPLCSFKLSCEGKFSIIIAINNTQHIIIYNGSSMGPCFSCYMLVIYFLYVSLARPWLRDFLKIKKHWLHFTSFITANAHYNTLRKPLNHELVVN